MTIEGRVKYHIRRLVQVSSQSVKTFEFLSPKVLNLILIETFQS